MNLREKLIELLHVAVCDYNCDECKYSVSDEMCIRHLEEMAADYLIANGVMIQEWIPMSEPLPEEGMPVLTFHNKYVEEYGNMVTAVRKNGNWYGCLGSTITHWSHLPPLPKGE